MQPVSEEHVLNGIYRDMFDDEPPVAFGPKLFPKNKINSTMPENENTKLIQDDVTAKPIRTNKKK